MPQALSGAEGHAPGPGGISAVPVTPVSRGSLGDRVAHGLRMLVIGGQLEPGTHLVEGTLASRFQVSRGPIRDALRALEAEGLVEPRRRGVYVLGFSADDLEDLYALRDAIEPQALRLAMRRSEADDWEPAAGMVQRMRDAAGIPDADAFAVADLDFHSEIYRLSRSRRLRSVWEQHWPTFAAVFSVTQSPDRDLATPLDRHARLLESARAGDEERAVATLLDINRGGFEERKRHLPSLHRD